VLGFGVKMKKAKADFDAAMALQFAATEFVVLRSPAMCARWRRVENRKGTGAQRPERGIFNK
jgi:hypothetical protein